MSEAPYGASGSGLRAAGADIVKERVAKWRRKMRTKAERLAAALRENLKRRKGRARALDAVDTVTAPRRA